MLAQLIINENARRGRAAAHQVRAALQRSNVAVVESGSPEDIGAGVDCIVAAGGDGTLISSIGVALARGLPLGVIPLGTFNELARTLHIPMSIDGAVDVIARGHRRTIDVGRVNGSYFVNESSMGVSSRISRMQTPILKQRFGLFGVIATSFSAFRHSRPFRAEIHHDGVVDTVRTIQVTIANSNRFGGFLQVAEAAIDDGWLDLYSVDIRNLVEAFAITGAMLAGVRKAVPGLRVLRSNRFEVRTRRPHRITADGEPAGETPAVFEILPGALSVYAPKRPVVSPQE